MKKNYLKVISIALVAIGMLFTYSCKKDTTTTAPAVEDGVYIYGAATALTTLDGKGLMDAGINEHVTVTYYRPGLYEKYIALKTGANFSIEVVAGSTKTYYSPATEIDSAKSSIQDNPQSWFARGTYTASTTTPTKYFTVPNDGLYHVAIDQTTSTFILINVPYWGVIGGATPLGWSEPRRHLMPGTFNTSTITFEIITDTLMTGDFKLRHSGGWKCRFIATCDSITINTNFGGVLTNLVPTLIPGGANYSMPGANRGYYKIDMVWTLGGKNFGWSYTMTKTGDVQLIDYSTYNMGIIGNAYLKANSDTANWDENFGTMLPVVSGKVYTWTYDITLIAGKDFKFGQGTDWTGKSIGYPDVTWAGTGASNFVNDGGNIKVVAKGKYKLVLVIDATTETYTLTATPE